MVVVSKINTLKYIQRKIPFKKIKTVENTQKKLNYLKHYNKVKMGKIQANYSHYINYIRAIDYNNMVKYYTHDDDDDSEKWL